MADPATPILTVTLNPALDIATSAESVVAGPKLRCEPPRVDPGGGGINVSRVIARLGGESRAFLALGGATGERLAAALAAEGIAAEVFPAPGETRESLSVTDRSTDAQYRFVLPGPVWTGAQGDAAIAAIAGSAGTNTLAVLSGSLPPGLPDDLPARLSRALASRSGRVVLDTSGAALARAARPEHPAYVLRMDAAEAEALAGRALTTRTDSADFAAGLVCAGAAEMVVIARGADGSVLASAGERWFTEAADVPVKSKVGAGDSFLAAFTLALSRGSGPATALQDGMAAASAAVMTEATELCREADMRRLVPLCPVEPV